MSWLISQPWVCRSRTQLCLEGWEDGLGMGILLCSDCSFQCSFGVTGKTAHVWQLNKNALGCCLRCQCQISAQTQLHPQLCQVERSGAGLHKDVMQFACTHKGCKGGIVSFENACVVL